MPLTDIICVIVVIFVVVVIIIMATEYHLGQLKAKIVKLRTQLLESRKVC